ncbi:hypothetical protein AB0H92_02325 [Streptomyces phaeochromogenes]|uniref:hypothetical protein n=1 Tax=Streptomyces phaeochromogenes TaxID=1923 RepID=UPI003408D0CF
MFTAGIREELAQTRATSTTAAYGVVAAHNYGLRAWLRSGGREDAVAAVDQALSLVHRTWSDTGETVVVVTRTDTPMWQVVQQLEGSWPGSRRQSMSTEFPEDRNSVPTETA